MDGPEVESRPGPRNSMNGIHRWLRQGARIALITSYAEVAHGDRITARDEGRIDIPGAIDVTSREVEPMAPAALPTAE